MSTHDHGVDEHSDGPETTQQRIARRLRTAPGEWVNHYIDEAGQDRRARRDMTLRAALVLSSIDHDEPKTDLEATAIEALRAIFRIGEGQQ